MWICQDLPEEENREEVGDGSVDRHGRIADKQKTGGWAAAPLIFGRFSL